MQNKIKKKPTTLQPQRQAKKQQHYNHKDRQTKKQQQHKHTTKIKRYKTNIKTPRIQQNDR